MGDRIFTDAGTPAGYGDTVELIKDKLGNGRLGPNQLDNAPDFESTWSLVNVSGDTSIVGNVLTFGSGSTDRIERRVDAFSIGDAVKFTVRYRRLASSNSSRFRLFLLDTDATTFTQGTFEASPEWATINVYHKLTTTEALLQIRGISSDTDGLSIELDVTATKLEHVPGNHALQTNSSLKPVLGRRPVGSEPTSDLDVYVEGEQHIEYLRFDGIDDCMTQTWPDGFEGDLIVCGTKGSWIDEGVSIPPGGELTIGPTGLPNTPGILPALGDIIGWVPVSRTTTEEERQRIIEYYKGRGAKGRLVPGPELVTNGAFDSADGWTLQNGWEISDGLLKLTGDVWSTASYSVDFTPGRIYKVSLDYSTDGPTSNGAMAYIRAGQVLGQGYVPKKTGTFDRLMLGGSGSFQIAANSFGDTTTFDNISVRELTPEEDLV